MAIAMLVTRTRTRTLGLAARLTPANPTNTATAAHTEHQTAAQPATTAR